MEHPLCILNKAPWVNSKAIKVANDFMAFINTTRYTETILMNYGIRPYNSSVKLDPTVFNTANGINPRVTPKTGPGLKTANYANISSLTYAWQNIKRPVFLQLLVDVSSGLTTTVNKKKTVGII